MESRTDMRNHHSPEEHQDMYDSYEEEVEDDPSMQDVEEMESNDQPMVDSLLPRIESDENSSPFPHRYDGDVVEEEVEIDFLNYDSVGQNNQPTTDVMMPNVNKEDTCSSPFPHLYTGDVTEEVEIGELFPLNEDEDENELSSSLENGIYDPDNPDMNILDENFSPKSQESGNNHGESTEQGSSISKALTITAAILYSRYMAHLKGKECEDSIPDMLGAEEIIPPTLLTETEETPIDEGELLNYTTPPPSPPQTSPILTSAAMQDDDQVLLSQTEVQVENNDSLLNFPATSTDQLLSSLQISHLPSLPLDDGKAFVDESNVFGGSSQIIQTAPVYFVYQPIPHPPVTLPIQDIPKFSTESIEAVQKQTPSPKKSRKFSPKRKPSTPKAAASTPVRTTPVTLSKQPPEDKETVERIYAILNEYAKQIRNSPDLQNRPARRQRSKLSPERSSRRRKSSAKKPPSDSSNDSIVMNSPLPMEGDSSSNANSQNVDVPSQLPEKLSNPRSPLDTDSQSVEIIEETVQDLTEQDKPSFEVPNQPTVVETLPSINSPKYSIPQNSLSQEFLFSNRSENRECNNISLDTDNMTNIGSTNLIVTEIHPLQLSKKVYTRVPYPKDSMKCSVLRTLLNSKETMPYNNINKNLSSSDTGKVKDFTDTNSATHNGIVHEHPSSSEPDDCEIVYIHKKRKCIMQNTPATQREPTPRPSSSMQNTEYVPVTTRENENSNHNAYIYGESYPQLYSHINSTTMLSDINSKSIIEENYLLSKCLPYTVRDGNTSDNERRETSVIQNVYGDSFLESPENSKHSELYSEVNGRRCNIVHDVMLSKEASSELSDNDDMPSNSISSSIHAVSQNGPSLSFTSDSIIQGKTVIVKDVQRSAVNSVTSSSSVMSHTTPYSSLDYPDGVHTIMVPLKHKYSLAYQNIDLFYSPRPEKTCDSFD